MRRLISFLGCAAVLAMAGNACADIITDGLVARLRADQNITLSGTGTVDQWGDMTANGNNAGWTWWSNIDDPGINVKPGYSASGFGDNNRAYLSFDRGDSLAILPSSDGTGNDPGSGATMPSGSSDRTYIVVMQTSADGKTLGPGGTSFSLNTSGGLPQLVAGGTTLACSDALSDTYIMGGVYAGSLGGGGLFWSDSNGVSGYVSDAMTVNAGANFYVNADQPDVWGEVGNYGKVAEILVYNRALSETEIQTVVGTLHTYYFAVPEPSSLALFAAGLVGLLAYVWRKRK